MSKIWSVGVRLLVDIEQVSTWPLARAKNLSKGDILTLLTSTTITTLTQNDITHTNQFYPEDFKPVAVLQFNFRKKNH